MSISTDYNVALHEKIRYAHRVIRASERLSRCRITEWEEIPDSLQDDLVKVIVNAKISAEDEIRYAERELRRYAKVTA